MKLKVSIIMNCYNGERYLRESLLSVINQTYKNWELIFWDNQSKDKSKNILRSFKDKRFKYFYSKNHTNLYTARNYAIKKAKGDIITFLDVDDIWLKDKLELQVPLFKNKNTNLVYGNFFVIYQHSIFKKKIIGHKKRLPTGYITNQLLNEYVVGLLTLAIRKKALKNYKEIFNSKFDLISDFDFVLDFSFKNKFDSIQKPIAISRSHSNQQQRQFFIKQAIDYSN